jgi:tyrosyl-tRNA synthetase
MIGDPSGKSEERNLLSEEIIRKNQEGIKKQVSRLLDFNDKQNGALLLNNYDWMKDYRFLDFIRNVGKHITVNYMMAKENVKRRISGEVGEGLSFAEFSYQLVQANDFLHLYKNFNCKLQMGGSDQWGNITTGIELIRRATGGEAYAITCPLITKADGTKFGKTEKGNVWLDPDKTSPYEFYQFWINTSDEDAEKYIKIFTELDKPTIDDLIIKHRTAPENRLLQKRLAEELTMIIHGSKALEIAKTTSEFLFGNGSIDLLKNLDSDSILSIFAAIPQFRISHNMISNGISIIDLLTNNTNILASKGEARRMIANNGIYLNKQLVNDENLIINDNYLIQNKFIVIQRGKKNYFLIIAE